MSVIIVKTRKSLKLSSRRGACAFGAIFIDIWHAPEIGNLKNAQRSRNAVICRLKFAKRLVILQNLRPARIRINVSNAQLKLWIAHCWAVPSNRNSYIFSTNCAQGSEIVVRLEKYSKSAPHGCSFVGNRSSSALTTTPAWTAQSYSRSLLTLEKFPQFQNCTLYYRHILLVLRIAVETTYMFA